ncbi:MAG TPA: 16S rRNA (cytosine(967)-C(5))-methyltransferase RsmB [Candidatus Acidoferrales bacterium]
MAISAARKIAYEILRRVESEGAYASDLLHSELGPQIKPEDAALATEIVMGVLRWQRLLDSLLNRHMKKSVDRLDLPVALALRIGIYQLRFLDRVPARAAVNESVELVKSARKASAATLVNAVLRRAGGEARKPPAKLLATAASNGEQLAILHSHPTWMVERWLARWGEERTRALLEANNRTPRLSCAIHDMAQRDAVTNDLRAAGLRISPGGLLESAFWVSGGSPARTEAFRTGKISIQDEASQMVPLLLEVQASERVLDLCAAPGGKTPPLVRGAGPGGMVVAGERHAHRLRAMREQFTRLNLSEVRLVEVDAEQALPFGVRFDRILVDAPCSGTGTLARHPEIRWRLLPEQLAEFHRLQSALLENAFEALAPGGRLVYSTCSMEPEENEQVVGEVLKRRGDARVIGADAGPSSLQGRLADGLNAKDFFDGEGFFRTLPSEHPADGFFAAIIAKS